jgi:transcriptional regulator with XRE-family HTH domain
MLTDKTPQPEETLGGYLRRIRKMMNLTQEEVAQIGGLHKQTLIKIEAGKTVRLNTKTRNGLIYALKIPEVYLDALLGETKEISLPTAIKICPRCWKPGKQPEAPWLDLRAKYCFLCGTGLRSSCSCGREISDWHYTFCPFCGKGLGIL